jgi:general stress protein 26
VRTARLLLAAGLAVCGRSAAAQATPIRMDLPTAARSIVDAAVYATFITIDQGGQPQARTVQPVAPDSNWVVWFATNPRTRKVAELRANPRATMHYFDRARLSYVTLSGRATLVTDLAQKRAHWNPAWTPFYADQDTSVVLVRMVPDRIEVVSAKLGVTGDSATWRPPSFTPKRP